MQIWVIDNNVPIERLTDSRMKTGELPADREGLKRLVDLDDSVWKGDLPLHELCRELLESQTDEILAFRHPQYTLNYLQQSPNRPDIIFFDWDFGDGKGGSESAKELEELYKLSFFLTQIFSSGDKGEIKKSLESRPALQAWSALILETKQKDKAELKKIISEAEEFYKKDFGALADPVRKAVTQAVEGTLRELGAMPIKDALELLGSNKDSKGKEAVDEFAQVFASSLASSLHDLAEVAGEKREDELKDLAIKAIAQSAQAAIESDKEILKTFRALAGKSRKLEDHHREALRKLLNFQMYHKPSDDFVRQGDIASILDEKGSVVDLVMVLNASCDLERCRVKTREVLTCLQLHPMTKDKGLEYVGRGGNPFIMMGDNISRYFRKKGSGASEGVIFFPSIELEKGLADYVAVAQEVVALRAEKIELKDADRLVYSAVALKDKRQLKKICSVNFNYVPAILGLVTKAMAGYGFPNLPSAEIDRLSKVVS